MKTILAAFLLLTISALQAETPYRYVALRLDFGSSIQLAALEKLRIPRISLAGVSLGRAISVVGVVQEVDTDSSLNAAILDPENRFGSKIVSIEGKNVAISEIYDRLCMQVGAVWMFEGDKVVFKQNEKQK